MLRRGILLVVFAALAPSIGAACLGLWTDLGSLQQHYALSALLKALLWLESFPQRIDRIGEGVVAWWELPLLLAPIFVFIGTARWWGLVLPWFLRWPFGLPEMVWVSFGMIAAGALVAVGAAEDRTLFLGGIVLSWVVAQSRGYRLGTAEDPGGWWARSNHLRRLAVSLFSVAVAYYGVTSLWEGATYRNPAFQVSEWWLANLGGSPWASGGVWLLAGGSLGGLAWLSRPRHRREDPLSDLAPLAWILALVVVVQSAATSAAGYQALASGLSSAGLLLLAAGWGPRLWSQRFPKRSFVTLLDPRELAGRALPILVWGGFCAARALSVFMWTQPTTLPVGVERLADASCVFSLVSEAQGGGIFYTDRCRTEVGFVSETGIGRRWDLSERGVDHVEELGGPGADGTLWAASAAYVDEGHLVMLAIEGRMGPRTVPAPGDHPPRSLTVADEVNRRQAPYVPIADCWMASWIPVPPGAPASQPGDVLIGCENRVGALLFRPTERRIVRDVPLTTRLEAGAFSGRWAHGYGVSLWADPDLHVWAWPSGKPIGRRTIGPFNWDVVAVPAADGESLWLPRFVEGGIAILDPLTLVQEAWLPLSFGIRAITYDPVQRRVWAAAAYSGRLWSIEADPPHRRESWALCGQTRDLTVDGQGRLTFASDCGLFRIDARAAVAQ